MSKKAFDNEAKNSGKTTSAGQGAGELAEEELRQVSGGFNEDEDPAFRGARCPRGVNVGSFPEKGKCYSTSPCSKCMFLDEDDDGSTMIFSCIRFNYRKEE